MPSNDFFEWSEIQSSQLSQCDVSTFCVARVKCIASLRAFTPSVIKTVENVPAALVTCVDMQLLADTSCCTLNLVSLGNNKMAKIEKKINKHTQQRALFKLLCASFVKKYIYIKKRKSSDRNKNSPQTE